jgi:hypothetical protein
MRNSPTRIRQDTAQNAYNISFVYGVEMMKKIPPETMSNTELDAACAQVGWETRLEAHSCLLSLMVGVAAAIAPWWAAHSATFDRFAGGLLYAGIGYVFILGVLGVRSRPFHRELQRRFGDGPFADRMLGLAKDLEQAEATEWILLLIGTGMPHGSSIDITVEIQRYGNARAVVKSAPSPAHTGNGKTVELDLPLVQTAPILGMLSEYSLPHFKDVEHFVRDGFPFEIGILGKRPAFRLRVKGNLAGLPEDRRNEPAVVLATSLLEIAHEAGAPPSGAGWCDAQGNIGMDSI